MAHVYRFGFSVTPRSPRLVILLTLAFVSLALAVPAARAQDEVGCCQFVTRSIEAGFATKKRECADLTPMECRATKETPSFFRGWSCDARAQRCIRGVQARGATATPTATPSPTPIPDTAAPATPGASSQLGCCQINRSSGPLCENSVTRARCLELFDGQASFCADCTCTGRQGPRLDFNPGTCVTSTTAPPRAGGPRRPARPTRPARPIRPH